MRSFWGFYDNGHYRVGCNGITIYVLDSSNKEIGKFKDIKYAYVGAFHPKKNIFVAKSTEGSLAVYDLDSMELLKKITITRIGAQDHGYSFSPNGEYFFNIESPLTSTATQLTVYRTSDFEIVETFFCDDKTMVLNSIEFDELSGDCYLLGFMRDATGVMDRGFIGKLVENEIIDMKFLTCNEYMYISAYKAWEQSGCTEKKFEWSLLKSYSKKTPVSLQEVHSKH